MPKAVLFDFDGVLADTLSDMLRFGQEVCLALGHARVPTTQDLNQLDPMNLEEYGRQLGIPDNNIKRYARLMLEHFRSKPEPPALFAGMGEVVKNLVESSHLAIVTGNATALVKTFLKHHGLDAYIHVIVGGEAHATRSQKIFVALNQLGVPAQGAWLVGDAISDIRAAQESGLKSVAVTWGHQSEAGLAAAGPDYIAHSPLELMAYLDGGISVGQSH